MPKFKVTAKVTTYCHIIVEAKDENEAYDIAKETDGGDFFTEEDTTGGWEILTDIEKVS